MSASDASASRAGAGQAGARKAGAPVRPETITLTSVPGFIVLDLPGAGVSAGGTRLAPDVTTAEVALLARAMTYKFAVLGAQVGGAKAGVRGDPAGGEGRSALMAGYCAEIRPLVESGRFLTGPDMGTFEDDFAPLRARNAAPSAMTSSVNGVPFEDLLTGFGVTAAADAGLRWGAAGRDDGRPGGWDGCSVAIEGFGKVGGGVATEVTRRGGRVVAVSTLAGCLADPDGLDVGRLLALRAEHGDRCVTAYGAPAAPPGPPARLFTVAADVIVPGTRPGVITAAAARALPGTVRVIAPAANAPYTRAGAAELHRRGILALPDFISNAGAVLGYRSPAGSTPDEVLAATDERITALTSEALGHPGGPLAGGCAMAEAFLRGWWGEPPEPPFAPGE